MGLTKEGDRKRSQAHRESFKAILDCALQNGYTRLDDESIYDVVLRYLRDVENGRDWMDEVT